MLDYYNLTDNFFFIVDEKVVPKKYSVKAGASVEFQCLSTSHVKNWLLNGGPLPSNAEIEEPNILIIRDIKSDNKGYYECEGLTSEIETFYSEGQLSVTSEEYCKLEYIFFVSDCVLTKLNPLLSSNTGLN